MQRLRKSRRIKIALCYGDRQHSRDPEDYWGLGSAERTKRGSCWSREGLPGWFRHTDWSLVDPNVSDHTILGRGPLTVNGQDYIIDMRSQGRGWQSWQNKPDIVVLMLDIRKPRRCLAQLCEAYDYIADGRCGLGAILAVAVYRHFWTVLWEGEIPAARKVASKVGALLLTHSLVAAAPPGWFLQTLVASHLAAEISAREWVQHWEDHHTTRLGARSRIILWDPHGPSTPVYTPYGHRQGDWGLCTQEEADARAIKLRRRSRNLRRKLRRREHALEKLEGRRQAAARRARMKLQRKLHPVDSETEDDA
ncbi:hypothetical protein C8R43DRAFT_946974 [Mycena crocata]|nr:hypothetical protein C8R43DRAFT_957868 [Mycena crocata]KAJ7163537.1 hypothetical protein C8R43DRAFT_946974 [Mycena crocata]